jgi:hypothetical protein
MHRDTIAPLDVGRHSMAKRIASMMDAAAWRDLLAELAKLQNMHPDLPQGNIASLSPAEFQKLSSAWVQAHTVAPTNNNT